MKISYRLILFWGMLLLQALYSLAWAQTQKTNPIQDALDSLWVQRPMENIYLQLDKSQYVPGETIWFKVYLVEGQDLYPSYLSTVAYVECWSPEDSLLSRKTIQLKNGVGTGDVSLSQKLTGGIYRLKTYTSWMQNSQTAFLQEIHLIDPNKERMAELPEGEKPDLQFLPESGALLAGHENRMAFKALGSDGLGVDLQGRILDNGGNLVQEFTSQHRGMGSILFTPEASKSYQAEVSWQGSTYRYPLPEVETQGYILSVSPSPFVTQVRIHSTGISPGSQIQLVGISRHNLSLFLRTRLEDGTAELSIPNSSFPTGVLQLTLLDEAGVPQCERMVWVDKNDQLDISVETSESTLGKRNLVGLDFTTQTQMGAKTPAQLAVSVVEENGIWESYPFRTSLKSQMLLASEAKGRIEAPWEYFYEEGTKKYIDLVMLTHLWRKISWEELREPPTTPPEFLIEQGLVISGKVMRSKNKALEDSKVTLMMDNMFQLRETQSDAEGRFIFPGLEYSDTTRLMLQARTKNNKSRPARFELDEKVYGDAPVAVDYSYDPFSNMEYIQRNVQARANLEVLAGTAQYELEEVEITQRKRSEFAQKQGSKLYREPSMTLDMSKQQYRQNVLEALKGRVPGLSISGYPGSYSINMRGGSSLVLSNEPLFLVDGFASDVNYVEALPMPLIDYVDIIKGPQTAIFGENGGNGVIAIYTKQGGDPFEREPTESEGTFRPELPGFSLQRQFYRPNYAEPTTDQNLPDLRSTLLWEPFVQTDNEGQGAVEFFTGDVPGTYRIIVEGVTPDGTFGYGTGQIVVE